MGFGHFGFACDLIWGAGQEPRSREFDQQPTFSVISSMAGIMWRLAPPPRACPSPSCVDKANTSGRRWYRARYMPRGLLFIAGERILSWYFPPIWCMQLPSRLHHRLFATAVGLAFANANFWLVERVGRWSLKRLCNPNWRASPHACVLRLLHNMAFAWSWFRRHQDLQKRWEFLCFTLQTWPKPGQNGGHCRSVRLLPGNLGPRSVTTDSSDQFLWLRNLFDGGRKKKKRSTHTHSHHHRHRGKVEKVVIFPSNSIEIRMGWEKCAHSSRPATFKSRRLWNGLARRLCDLNYLSSWSPELLEPFITRVWVQSWAQLLLLCGGRRHEEGDWRLGWPHSLAMETMFTSRGARGKTASFFPESLDHSTSSLCQPIDAVPEAYLWWEQPVIFSAEFSVFIA